MLRPLQRHDCRQVLFLLPLRRRLRRAIFTALLPLKFAMPPLTFTTQHASAVLLRHERRATMMLLPCRRARQVAVRAGRLPRVTQRRYEGCDADRCHTQRGATRRRMRH